jgi:RimJ/RimL family protein N-acetyltransferase
MSDELRAPVTARLRGEPLGPQHHDALLAVLTDPRVAATLGGAPPAEWIPEHIAEMQAHWREHGFGWYAWLDRESGAFVARGGPHWSHIAGRDEVEIGWTVVPERWRRGLATELGARSVELAFGPLALDEVVSFTLVGNVASRRVMEKLGFAYEADADYKGWRHALYRLRRTASTRSTSSSVV